MISKIFVGYTNQDKDSARQITDTLPKAGLEPRLDVQELRTGDQLILGSETDSHEGLRARYRRALIFQKPALCLTPMIKSPQIQGGREKHE